jgi:hypothetical protein
LRSEWQRVADCESGGNWSAQGAVYSGIGFANTTWANYGGLAFAPNAGLATEDQQIEIGMKITGDFVPDQEGCGAW